MRLVNGDKRYVHVAQLGLKQAAAQSFRRNVEQFDVAQNTVLEYAQDVVMLQSGIDGFCSDANLPEVVHLILHQGNERSDDYARTFHSHSRHLEGDGLATTRRHQAQGIVTSTDGLDDVALYAAKVIVAPIVLKNLCILIDHGSGSKFFTIHSSPEGMMSSICSCTSPRL